MPKDTYMMTVAYDDGTKQTPETSDVKRAMNDTSSACWEEDQAKTVTLAKNGDAIFSEKIKAREKSEGMIG